MALLPAISSKFGWQMPLLKLTAETPQKHLSMVKERMNSAASVPMTEPDLERSLPPGM